jgi:hypothetical protein
MSGYGSAKCTKRLHESYSFCVETLNKTLPHDSSQAEKSAREILGNNVQLMRNELIMRGVDLAFQDQLFQSTEEAAVPPRSGVPAAPSVLGI